MFLLLQFLLELEEMFDFFLKAYPFHLKEDTLDYYQW
jgi:hypothetical protein